MANAIASRWSPRGIGGAAGELPAAARRGSRPAVRRRRRRARGTRDQRRDAVALLDAQLGGAGHVQRRRRAWPAPRAPAVRRSARALRRAPMTSGPRLPARTRTVPRGSPCLRAVVARLHPRAEAPQHVEQRGAGRVQADVLRSRDGAGSAAAATSQKAAEEKSPGTVASMAAQTLAALRRDTVRRRSCGPSAPNARSARSV